MGDPKGFLKIKRQAFQYRPICERVKDYREVMVLRSDRHSQEQASRCMDCGTPFCHWGCPLGNFIPEWNDFMFMGQWKKAFEFLQATNNFPEITARLCPAICEYACVLGINDDPIAIKENELAIIEYAFSQGFIKPNPPKNRTNKRVAVVGSGPAGLSCADQLNKAGHKVAVFERDDRIGGILRYGIPDFKLEKWVIDRRLEILEKEGIEFVVGMEVGTDYKISKLKKEFDAVCLSCGSRIPRDLKIEGRNLKGIYFAMDYLIQANKKVAGEKIAEDRLIDARGKKVVVIGGGDTGSNCVGTAHRQGASSVIQIELLSKPSQNRSEDYPWPTYPLLLKTSTSHEEGGERLWSVLTKKFIGENGHLKKLSCLKVEFIKQSYPHGHRQVKNRPIMKEMPGTEFEIDADLAILALGFIHPEPKGLLSGLAVKLDKRGNVKTDRNYQTSVKGIFSAGDMRRGQSLVAWAISEGRGAALAIDKYLMEKT